MVRFRSLFSPRPREDGNGGDENKTPNVEDKTSKRDDGKEEGQDELLDFLNS